MFNRLQSQKFNLFVLIGFVCFYITGCGVSKRATTPGYPGDKSDPPERPSVQTNSEKPLPMAMDISPAFENITSIEKQLENAHLQWKGTPYRYGGETRKGIDCSAFTQQVFRDFFGKKLPRHTRTQLQTGISVRRRSIKTGDLIFFRTGRQSLHVGISLGNGDFLHASVSSGVMVSNMGEKYWAARFLGARRVL